VTLGLALLAATSFEATGFAATLAGRVEHADGGDPVAGVTVQAFDLLLDALETETDSDGAWRIEDVPAGTWRVRAVPPYTQNLLARWHPDATAFCASEGLTLAADTHLTDVDLSLPAGATLSGRLLDGSGSPLINAPVWAVGADEATDGLADRPTLTDAGGRFTIKGIDAPADGPGVWWAYAQADDFPEQFLGPTYDSDDAETLEIPAGSDADIGDWTLLDGILVEGLVTGPDGGVAGATVHVYSTSQVVTVTADDDGRYVAMGLPPGDVLPWVSADGLALTYFPDADRPTGFLSAPNEGEVVEDADLFPPAEARLVATLVDGETGAPTPGLSALLYNDTRTVGRGNLADEDGILVIDSLHGGAYSLYVWGQSLGYVDDWVRGPDGEPLVIAIEAEEDTPSLSLSLARAGQVSGAITNDDGGPVAGATVVLRRDDGDLAAGISNRDGLYTIGGLPDGSWTVQAGLDPLCPGDPSVVTSYLGPTVNPDWQTSLTLQVGEQRTGTDFVLPVDQEGDGMADEWERGWGLDPDRNDAGEDPDGDTYDNLTEYRLDTNPVEADATSCSGCGGAGGAAGLAFLLPLAWRRRR
jgi:hypothetical protein